MTLLHVVVRFFCFIQRIARKAHRSSFCFGTLSAACLMVASATASAAPEELRGPDVVIIASEDKVVYEYRQNGQLRMVRVVPDWGKPYYLVPRDPTKGFGDLERADALIPRWVIAEF